MSHELATPESFGLTPTGLIVKGKPTIEECLEFGSTLFYFAGMAPLIIADLYLYTAQIDEAAAASMVPAIGRTKHTLQNWLSIAKQFPVSRRREGLEMGHYDAIAGIKTADGFPDYEKQDAIIEKAAKESWPISKTRDEVQKITKPARKVLVQANDGPRQIDGEIVEDGDGIEDDKPIFDSTGAGQGMSAEDRREKLDAVREQDLRDTNQNLLSVVAKIESFGNAENFIRELNVANLSRSRIAAAATFLADLALKVSKAQENHAFKVSSRSGNPPRGGGRGVNQSPDEVESDLDEVGIHDSESGRPADSIHHATREGRSAKSGDLPPINDDVSNPSARVSPTS